MDLSVFFCHVVFESRVRDEKARANPHAWRGPLGGSDPWGSGGVNQRRSVFGGPGTSGVTRLPLIGACTDQGLHGPAGILSMTTGGGNRGLFGFWGRAPPDKPGHWVALMHKAQCGVLLRGAISSRGGLGTAIGFLPNQPHKRMKGNKVDNEASRRQGLFWRGKWGVLTSNVPRGGPCV